jgi:dTMP kinase
MARGRFITLEGGEGAGKSTQARHLVAAFARAGLPVLATREPGGTPAAERVRALLLDPELAWTPLAETLLHGAARAEHVARVIGPALAAGTHVVCDRFADSTLAYQGYGLGCDRAAIAALAGVIGLVPDLTLVLDLAPAETAARLAARGTGADRYERLGAGFFARVQDGFRAIARAEPERCFVIAAGEEEARVAARIRDIVRARLGLPL